MSLLADDALVVVPGDIMDTTETGQAVDASAGWNAPIFSDSCG